MKLQFQAKILPKAIVIIVTYHKYGCKMGVKFKYLTFVQYLCTLLHSGIAKRVDLCDLV